MIYFLKILIYQFILKVKFLMGGKWDVVTKSGGSLPQQCLIDYLEAVDAFANRVETVANNQKISVAGVKSVQDIVQVILDPDWLTQIMLFSDWLTQNNACF